MAGTGVGALAGAGTGYFSSQGESEDIRRRQALTGAAVGAGVGALAGSLSGASPEKMMEQYEKGHAFGQKHLAEALSQSPDNMWKLVSTMPAEGQAVVVDRLLSRLSPEAKDKLMKHHSTPEGGLLGFFTRVGRKK